MNGSVRIHGGTDALGSARYDFSTNSNACGPCPAAWAAVQAADATRYPDAAYTRLREALAALHGVDAWRIVLAGSTSECIFRLTAWAQGAGARRVWLPNPAYGDYGHAAQAWNLQRVDSVAQADLVWACDPSSPLGQAQTPWALTSLAPRSEDSLPSVRVLDCAYAPLRLNGQATLTAVAGDTAWCLWSPNKALGLTGVRAAYAIAPLGASAAVQQLDGLAPSWPLGSHGEALLLAWSTTAVQDWVRQSLATLAQWKQAQMDALHTLGWHCLPSDTHFFCARAPQTVALAQCLACLRAQGIKLRDTADMGLPGHVRLSAQPWEAQEALRRGLQLFGATLSCS